MIFAVPLFGGGALSDGVVFRGSTTRAETPASKGIQDGYLAVTPSTTSLISGSGGAWTTVGSIAFKIVDVADLSSPMGGTVPGNDGGGSTAIRGCAFYSGATSVSPQRRSGSGGAGSQVTLAGFVKDPNHGGLIARGQTSNGGNGTGNINTPPGGPSGTTGVAIGYFTGVPGEGAVSIIHRITPVAAYVDNDQIAYGAGGGAGLTYSVQLFELLA